MPPRPGLPTLFHPSAGPYPSGVDPEPPVYDPGVERWLIFAFKLSLPKTMDYWRCRRLKSTTPVAKPSRTGNSVPGSGVAVVPVLTVIDPLVRLAGREAPSASPRAFRAIVMELVPDASVENVNVNRRNAEGWSEFRSVSESRESSNSSTLPSPGLVL